MNGERGVTLVELMIAVAIGVGLVAAAVNLYVQGRAAYRATESIARLQEQGRFALAVIEPDVEMAGHFGFTNDPSTISLVPELPSGLNACGVGFALDVMQPVQGSNGRFALPCPPYQSGAVSGADTLTTRRVDTREARPEANRLQIHASRFTSLTSQTLFFDGVAPGVLDENHRVHNLLVRTYYVARDSVGRRSFPALRVKSLARSAFDEDEVMSGIEDLQVQFGIGSGATARYVNADSAELMNSRVVAVRVWLRVRADEPDAAFRDERNYRYADVTYTPSGADRHFRRAVILRTVAVRNARRE